MRIKFVEGPQKGKVVELDGERNTLGRETDADVVIDDEEVSRSHAELLATENGIEIRDLGSRNGTRVDGSRITESTAITVASQVEIGTTVLTFDADAGASETRVSATRLGGAGALESARVPAMLEVISGPDEGKTIEVSSEGVRVGRDSGTDLMLSDDDASREHLEVRTNPDRTVQLTDLDSSNGTVVDGRKISGTVAVSDGSEIAIGNTRIALRDLESRRNEVDDESPAPSLPPSSTSAAVESEAVSPPTVEQTAVDETGSGIVFCEQCGTQLDTSDLFCFDCGAGQPAVGSN